MIHNCTQFNPKFHLFFLKKIYLFLFHNVRNVRLVFSVKLSFRKFKKLHSQHEFTFFSNRSIFCAIKSFSCYLFSLCCPLSSMYIKDCLRCVFFVSCYTIWRWHLHFFFFTQLFMHFVRCFRGFLLFPLFFFSFTKF